MSDHFGLETKDHECLFCNTNLQGNPIPLRDRHLFGGSHHFSRVIGVEYGYNHPGHWDGVSEWMCPDCGARVNRFTGEYIKHDNEYATREGNVVMQ